MEFVFDLGAEPAKRLDGMRQNATRGGYTLEGGDETGVIKRGILVVGAYALDDGRLTVRVYLPPEGWSRERVEAQMRAFVG